jgi:hypothetical protein
VLNIDEHIELGMAQNRSHGSPMLAVGQEGDHFIPSHQYVPDGKLVKVIEPAWRVFPKPLSTNFVI